MKKLELIYTEKTKEQLKNKERIKEFEFYLLDLDKIKESPDISIALIKVNRDNELNETVLDKVFKIIEELYSNQEYIVLYDKL